MAGSSSGNRDTSGKIILTEDGLKSVMQGSIDFSMSNSFIYELEYDSSSPTFELTSGASNWTLDYDWQYGDKNDAYVYYYYQDVSVSTTDVGLTAICKVLKDGYLLIYSSAYNSDGNPLYTYPKVVIRPHFGISDDETVPANGLTTMPTYAKSWNLLTDVKCTSYKVSSGTCTATLRFIARGIPAVNLYPNLVLEGAMHASGVKR